MVPQAISSFFSAAHSSLSSVSAFLCLPCTGRSLDRCQQQQQRRPERPPISAVAGGLIDRGFGRTGLCSPYDAASNQASSQPRPSPGRRSAAAERKRGCDRRVHVGFPGAASIEPLAWTVDNGRGLPAFHSLSSPSLAFGFAASPRWGCCAHIATYHTPQSSIHPRAQLRPRHELWDIG